MTRENEMTLVVDGLVRRFGGVKALDGVSLSVDAGRIRALIGPNGSGKSTLINCVSGVDTGYEGSVQVAGLDMAKRGRTFAARHGVARTFQTLRLFDDMTVLENVLVAMHFRRGYGLLSAIAVLPRFRRAEQRMREKAMGLLAHAGVAGDAHRLAGTLPYGHRRLVEIGRALALEPELLLLDEPAAGMNDAETARLAGLVTDILRPDLAILVVEHNMDFIASVASDVTVLDNGKVIAEGTPAEIRQHPEVLAAYLGVSEEER